MTSRYDRQLPIFGEEGQDRLRTSTVGVIGCGGLGSTVITALSSAGVGRLVLVDRDSPDESNLNRQFIYRSGQTGRKADIAGRWAVSVNPDVSVVSHPLELTDGNCAGILSGCDVLVDCLDTVAARRMLNRYAVSSGKILVHAGVSGFQGQVTVVVPGRTPCLECILNDIGTVSVQPAVGCAVSFIGSAEAAEAVKMITGTGEPLAGRLLVADLEHNHFETVDLKRRPACPVCGVH